jgi:hypothetical protein
MGSFNLLKFRTQTLPGEAIDAADSCMHYIATEQSQVYKP